METKQEEVKTMDVTITIKNDIGGFGFSLCQILGGQLIIKGEDEIDRKNFNAIYSVLSDVNKKAIDNYINVIKNDPKFIEAARQQLKSQDEAKIRKFAEQNNKGGGVN